MDNLLIAMSGGTTTVINSTLAGIIKQAKKSKHIDRIYAGYPGIQGILNENMIDLTDLTKQELKYFKKTPASSFIGATRIPKLTTYQYQRLDTLFDKHNIKYFLNIGGNGTIKQSMSISQNISQNTSFASLPKTVDNDLGDDEFKKMYFTPGFPSCANYWMHKLLIFNEENLGANQHDKVLVAQTFGRETGFIAGTARLADPERKMPLMLLLPEDQQPLENVIAKVKETVDKKGRALIVMSEGYKIGKIESRKDHSGQTMYSSSKNLAGQLLCEELNKQNIQARAFIPGFDQRDEILLTLEQDIEIAYKLGKYAIKSFEKGKKDFLIGITENTLSKNEFITVPLKNCENYTRKMPSKFIKKGCFDVTDKYIDYLKTIHRPGNLKINYDSNGMPKFIEKKYTYVKKLLKK